VASYAAFRECADDAQDQVLQQTPGALRTGESQFRGMRTLPARKIVTISGDEFQPFPEISFCRCAFRCLTSLTAHEAALRVLKGLYSL